MFYQSYKQSPSKDDFSEKKPFKYKGNGYIPDSIPLILLTNPNTYSAGNFFAYIMNEFPNCISVGLPTGGGDEPIQIHLLPNGWTFSYPYFRNYSLQGVRFENHLVPDYMVQKEGSLLIIGGKYSSYHDEQFIRALCLLNSINEYPYIDYTKIWE